ncbi:hypothetical protein PBI_SCTP2_462 [Salicola phage SCTP-2]|nr:hypothetical protein PBI_SCTP2_462 [Salicola phage SCTP-2]
MKLEQLFEDPQTDKQFRQQALDVYNKFVNFVDEHGLEGFRKTPKGDYYLNSSDDLGINHTLTFKILIRVLDEETKKSKFQGQPVAAGVDGDKRILVMYIDQSTFDIFDEFIKNDNRRKLFVHELTHLYDQDRSFQQIKPSSKEETLRDYYNTPAEYNAYYQEGIDNFENRIELFHKKAKENSERIPSLQSFLEKRFGGDSFEQFLDVIYNHFDKEFINYLSDDNHKRLKKRLYQYYDENKQDLYDLTQYQ